MSFEGLDRPVTLSLLSPYLRNDLDMTSAFVTFCLIDFEAIK